MKFLKTRSNRNNIFNLCILCKGYGYSSGYSLFFFIFCRSYIYRSLIYIIIYYIIIYIKKFLYVADLSFIPYTNKSPFTKKKEKKTRSNRNNIFNLCILCKRLRLLLRLLLVFILCIYRVAVRVL